jgi:hypothetical protein
MAYVSQRTREIGVRLALGSVSRTDPITFVAVPGLLPAGQARHERDVGRHGHLIRPSMNTMSVSFSATAA